MVLHGPTLLSGSKHLKHLHTVPAVESEVDRCIECGYCEPVCPSRNLTTIPRQRIALRREMLRQPIGSQLGRTLLSEYEYAAVETCAGDGSCILACPVGINTGDLMKRFRHEEHGPIQEFIADEIAEHWGVGESLARQAVGLNTLAVKLMAGAFLAQAATTAARLIFSNELVPL